MQKKPNQYLFYFWRNLILLLGCYENVSRFYFNLIRIQSALYTSVVHLYTKLKKNVSETTTDIDFGFFAC